MKTKITTYFLAFLIVCAVLGTDAFAAADVEGTRYFIQTTKGFWKTTLGARNSFDDGFTADLSDWQFRFAKYAGLKLYAVKKLSILPAEEAPVVQEYPGQDTGGIKGRKPSPSPTPARPLPTAQIPWGVGLIYADPLLTVTSGGASVSIAVLDTGAFRDHPDLKRRIAECKDFTAAKQPVVDGKCDDKNGHGTHVAGIIAADGGADGLGVYGMAPEASLLAYKVCGPNGSCWSDDIAVALRTAADNGAKIVNLSLGSDSVSSLISDAVDYAVSKGVLVVAAAGNDGPYQDSIDYPGALVNTVSVGALDSTKKAADWSSRGINTLTVPYERNERDLEIAAPGVNIESTSKDGGYVILSGTSMATPHIAGLAAKEWQFLDADPAGATRDMLHALSHDILPPGDDDASGWGLPALQ